MNASTRRARGAWVALLVAAVFGCAGDAPLRASNLLLISVDTLRPDMLGCYGYPRPTSPALDRIAAEGALFENAFTTAPWTLPAHASLLTGLYPRRHGAIGERSGIADGVETLAMRLVARGYRTAAFVNSYFVSARYGFARGFQDFEWVRKSGSPAGDRMTLRAQRWLAAEPRDRFFLLLHDYQVHSDYRSLPEFERAFTGHYSGSFTGATAELRAVREGKLRLEPADALHLKDLYAASIRQLDEEIGALRGFLERAGLWEKTLLVVTSDHGEEFLEHGGVLHGQTQYDEVLRIPLILRGPGVPAGLRVSRAVSILDVLPTVLALLGVPGPDGIDGVDLLAPAPRDGADAVRFLFSEADHTNREPDIRRSVRGPRWKLVLDRLAEEHAVYDLGTDPGERHDVKHANPEQAQRLLAELERFEAGRADGRPLPPTSPEIREQLEALGYVEP